MCDHCNSYTLSRKALKQPEKLNLVVDIESAGKHFPDHIIAGNVNPQVIAAGTPQEVYRLSREAIEKGKRHCPSGFVLMPGCEIPPTTIPYNLYVMRKAVEECGWYD